MQSDSMAKAAFTFVFSFFFISSNSQSFIGAGFGTFNIPGAINKFRGNGPTVKYEFISDNQRTSAYSDFSYFNKIKQDGTVAVYNSSGDQIGYADAETKFSYIYSQIGMKRFLLGDADEKKIMPYTGGGIALVLANSTTSYKSNVGAFPDNKANRFLFGFHFNAGLQYNLSSLILELRGNLDIVLKPLINDGTSDASNILTNLRLSALLPISK